MDFEIDGESWRIRKQFLSARAAELKNLRSGQIARGGDAETQLENAAYGKRWGWSLYSFCGSNRALRWCPSTLKETGGASLVAAIEREVETAADGGAARFVQAKLKEELAGLVTSHAPPRPTGRYKAALDEHQTLLRQRDEAQTRLDQASKRLDRLQGIRQEVARLSDPTAAAARSAAVATTKRAFEEASAAREKCRAAEEAVKAQEETLVVRRAALSDLDAKIADLSKLEEAAGHDAPALSDIERRAVETEAQSGTCKSRRDELKAALVAAEQDRKAIEAAGRLRELAQRLEAARAAAAEHKDLNRAFAANGAEDGLVAAVRRESQSIATIGARLSAAAPTVSIAYDRSAKAKITVDGRALADGETLNPTKPVALAIEGVGVVTVAPGQAGRFGRGRGRPRRARSAARRSVGPHWCRLRRGGGAALR